MTNNQMKEQSNGKGAGTYTQTGFKATNGKPSTAHLYCMKCGQLKSAHTGIFHTTCPKK